MVSHLACVKTDVEAYETIQNSGLVYSIHREKLYQLIVQQEFVQNIASHQMFISGEMVFQTTLAALQRKMIAHVFLMELLVLSYIST